MVNLLTIWPPKRLLTKKKIKEEKGQMNERLHSLYAFEKLN